MDGADFLTWQLSFGSTSDLAADGNGDGQVTVADVTFWEARYGPVDPLPAAVGNFDGDADVDGADFLTWQQDFQSALDLAADANRDGLVDAADLAVWESEYSSVGTARGAISLTELDEGLMFAVGASVNPLSTSFSDDEHHASAVATVARDAGIFPHLRPGFDLAPAESFVRQPTAPQASSLADKLRRASPDDATALDLALAAW